MVGFISMTSNTALDPKVWYKLGEGGVPEEAHKRIKFLVADYEKSVGELDGLGHNRGIMDLETIEVEELGILKDEEELIASILSKIKSSTKLAGSSNVGYKNKIASWRWRQVGKLQKMGRRRR